MDATVKTRQDKQRMEQINWQKVHGIQQEYPDKHGQCQGRHQLAAFGIVDDAFGLSVYHFKQNFDGSLKAARHTRSGFAGGLPQQKAAHNAQQNAPENGVYVEDGKVNHT
jgi:hypothetical protein